LKPIRSRRSLSDAILVLILVAVSIIGGLACYIALSEWGRFAPTP
jgi:hypothetical protein